jgi:protein SCO1
MPRTLLILAGVILGISLSAILVFGRFATPAPVFHGTFINPPDPRPDFQLRSGDETIRRSTFMGRPLVVVFGYTSCPDVCPTTMSRLARVMSLLGEDASNVQVALISVDPGRDDPDRIQDYAAGFDPRFVGLTADRETLAAVARDFGIYHQKAGESGYEGHGMPATDPAAHAPDHVGDAYLVDHTTSVTVLDANGDARLLWANETPPEAMAEDLRTLIRLHD